MRWKICNVMRWQRLVSRVLPRRAQFLVDETGGYRAIDVMQSSPSSTATTWRPQILSNIVCAAIIALPRSSRAWSESTYTRRNPKNPRFLFIGKAQRGISGKSQDLLGAQRDYR